MMLLDISNMDFRKRSRWLFQDLQLTVNTGELIQLIGGSGSGKTTLTELISGWRKPSSGNIRLNGPVSVVTQIFSLYSDLTVSENLEFYSQINDRKSDTAAILKWAGLSDMANVRAAQLPIGYRRMLQIAVAVNRDFSLLILDEADTGLDQAMQSRVWQMFHDLKSAGKSILAITSHPVADVAFDRMLMLRDGKIINYDSLEQVETAAGLEVKQ